MTVHFLDTGFLIALESSDDRHHAQALAAWHDIGKHRAPLVTTSYVFDEVTTFFNSRGHHAKAVQIGEALLNSQALTLVHIDESLFTEAWREFSRHADTRWSLTDCVSFVLMRRRRIKKALAFDKHFTQAGFERMP